jgi:hypothetical protein
MRRSWILVVLSGLALTLLLAATRRVLAAAPGAREVLRAHAIELIDDRGRVRAQLDVEQSGEVVLRLRDENGVIRVKLGASQDGSGLLLLDEKTEPGVHLLAKDDGTSLTLSDGGQRRVLEPNG